MRYDAEEGRIVKSIVRQCRRVAPAKPETTACVSGFAMAGSPFTHKYHAH